MKCINDMKKIFFALCLFMVSNLSFAQTSDISIEEMESYKARCKEYMDAFLKGLGTISDKTKSDYVKKHQVKVLLTFFMGEGKPYTDVNGKKRPAVEMEVTSVRYGQQVSKHSMPLVEYFDRLQRLNYVSVKITQAKTCVISNLYKVSDNQYEATATFFQYFEGQRGDGTFYRDKTQKDIKVYLTKVTDGNLGTFWDLKFGNISVVDTIKM